MSFRFAQIAFVLINLVLVPFAQAESVRADSVQAGSLWTDIGKVEKVRAYTMEWNGKARGAFVDFGNKALHFDCAYTKEFGAYFLPETRDKTATEETIARLVKAMDVNAPVRLKVASKCVNDMAVIERVDIGHLHEGVVSFLRPANR